LTLCASDPDNSYAEMTWTCYGNTALIINIRTMHTPYYDATVGVRVPNGDWNGVEQVTFRATDPDGLYGEQVVTFTVLPVNDPPVVSGIPDQTIDEGSSFTPITLDDYVHDVDNANSEMTWSSSGNTGLSVNIVDRVATITAPDPDWNGAETITFRATDPGDLYGEYSALFTVAPVNDPPLATPQNVTTNERTAIPIVLSGFDIDGNIATYTIASLPSHGTLWDGTTQITTTPTDLSNTTVEYRPAIVYYGSDSFTFTVTDDGTPLPAQTSSPATVAITIISVNHPPVADIGGPYESYRGKTITFDASRSTDPDSDVLHYRWDFENDGTWDTSYSTNPTTTHVWNVNHSGLVAVEVSDGRASDIDTTSVTVQNVTIVSLIDSTGAPLSGGVVQYYSGGWQSFGTTNASGQVSKAIPCGNYKFRMTYEFASVEKYQNVGVNPVVVFQTVHTVIELRDSQNQLIDQGAVMYYSGGWHDLGTTTNGQVQKELLPYNYKFRMTYEFASVEKYQDVGITPVVTFQTVHTVIELRNSQNQLIDQGTVMYYSGGWHDLGTTTNGQVQKELLPYNYKFRMTYEFASVEKYQDVGVNPIVVFQTVCTVVQLRNSQNQLIDQGAVMYYSGGWHDLGVTVGGQVQKELLPYNYKFRMTYQFASVEKYQDVNVNPVVVFQTVHTIIELRNSQNQLIDQGAVMYYSGGWYDLGTTTNGQVQKELLPYNYKFRMTYQFASVEKYQDVGVNPTVTFQTIHTVIELRNSQNQLIDQGAVMYYSGGWHDLGMTTGGQVQKELLPYNYKFRMTYEYASVEKYQDVGINPVVIFQTVRTIVQLRNSQNQLIDQGTVMYYSGGWYNFGVTVGWYISKELLPYNYKFRMTYGFASVEMYQDVGVNPIVQFQTGKVQSDSGRCTMYYSGGWRTFTNGMELLPAAYKFRFNDGTADTSYTIIAGVTNHIH